MKASVSFAIIVLAMAGAARAQTCHTLSGAWRLDRADSLMGSGLSFNPRYAVDGIVLTMAQEPNGTVHESWRMSGPHVLETEAFAVTPDGVRRPTHTSSVLDTTSEAVEARWLNCTLNVKALSHLFGQEVWTDNNYIVDSDGRRLTILQTSHSEIGDAERHLVFLKDGH